MTNSKPIYDRVRNRDEKKAVYESDQGQDKQTILLISQRDVKCCSFMDIGTFNDNEAK